MSFKSRLKEILQRPIHKVVISNDVVYIDDKQQDLVNPAYTKIYSKKRKIFGITIFSNSFREKIIPDNGAKTTSNAPGFRIGNGSSNPESKS